MRTRALVVLLVASLAAASLTGCLGKKTEDVQVKSEEQKKAETLLGESGRETLVDAAAIIPKNYSFPDQNLLPTVTASFAGKVDTSAVGGYEGENDVGGIEYRTVTRMEDITAYLPPGQPAEMQVKLFWDASEANSADLDIVVDVPGTKTSLSTKSETLNWNYAVKTMVVNTLGVAGQPHQVGVQIASALASQGFDYKLDVQFTYPKDVLTPYHAWMLDVPPNAGGIIVESEKAGGDEHLRAQFILIDPDDNLVQYVLFDDINIPTESVFLSTPKPGKYVFYAYEMHGGFLRVKADVPLVEFHARPLPLVETKDVLSSELTPGVAGKDALGAVDNTGAATLSFAPAGAFPLRVVGYISGSPAAMAKVELATSAGPVHMLRTIAAYEDEQGSIGWTTKREGSSDNRFTWENIQKGGWTARIVNDGPIVEIGYTVLSYTR